MRIQLLAAATLIAATSLAGGTGAWASTAAGPHIQARVNVRPDTMVGYGFGTGPTAQAARKAALEDLDGDWRGCQPAILEGYSKPHVIEKKKSARAASNASW
jgi:hypothetical protein